MPRCRGDENTQNELRARLEALNRKFAKDKKPKIVSASELRSPSRPRRPSPAPKKPTKPSPIVYYRDLPRMKTQEVPPPKGARICLEEAVDGDIWETALHGKAYVVSTTVNDLDGAETLSRRFQDSLREGTPGLVHHVSPVIPVEDLTVDDVVFMDIETTGLGNTPVFLVGVMVWSGDGFEVQQYLARNYAEERAIVSLFVDACKSRKLLVTFNGKSFDFPFLRTRAAATGVPYDLAPAHLDLLHVGRRIWKGQFENCKLQTLESRVCGRVRHGDIPGSQIPDAYHRYVRTENAWQIVEVLKHNMLDLVTLADIMIHFPDPEE